jgi:ribosomal protein S18 acetylase RimI-like enzyme
MTVSNNLTNNGTTMDILIRQAMAEDEEPVREIILWALRETNALDYPPSVIDRLALTLPNRVAANLQNWCSFVAIVKGRVVGTGSLDGRTVTSVYVHPDYQGRGIGTKLMDAIESAANTQSQRTLIVQSSVTAKMFYANLGFRVVQEGSFGEERTILMSKDM